MYKRQRVARALYGAKQSAHLWRKRLDEWLRDYGFEQTTHDECVYVLRTGTGEEMHLGA